MSSPSIEFPFIRFHRHPFGILYRPVVPVAVTGRRGVCRCKFTLDSGAEFTMVPKRIAEYVGIDVEEFSETTVTGIEGTGVSGVIGPLSIRIGLESLTVRCFFAHRDDVPFLLGRMDFFNRFNVLFDARGKRVVLRRV